MKTIAIIAEYNPFHNGHLYHLNTAMCKTNATYSVALMSGNFLQRGVPAMWDKYTRATMAARCGIDLVLELPFVYSTGSAKDFATGAVTILDKLNSIDYLCFGAETDDLNLLSSISDVINNEPCLYKEQLNLNLNAGMSYPQARSKALCAYFNSNKELSDIIIKPNNILAIEYIAALKRLNSSIEPVIIKRKKASYHDTTLYESISSASAIRTAITNKNFDINSICHDIPADVLSLISGTYRISWPINIDDLTPYLQCKLINSTTYTKICDISETFSNKLSRLSPIITYEDAIKTLSSKDLTNTRICRSLLHMIMDYLESDRDCFIFENYALYASILALKKTSSQIIKYINTNTDIPLITKNADFEKYFNNFSNLNLPVAKAMWNYDTKATLLYNCLVYNSMKTKLPNDYNVTLPII